MSGYSKVPMGREKQRANMDAAWDCEGLVGNCT